MKRFLFSTVMLLCCNLAFGQGGKFIDSLEQHVDRMDGVQKASTLYELVNYFSKVDIEKAKFYAGQANRFLIGKDEAARAYALLGRGILCSRTGKIDSAMLLYHDAERAARVGNNDHALTRILAALAYANIQSGKPAKGIEYLYEGLRIEDRSPDEEMEYKLRTNIVWAYLELKQYENAISQGRTLLSLIGSGKFEWIAMYTYNNMAICYGATGKLDSARFYIDKGIKAAEDVEDNQHIANAYFILGTIYGEAGKFNEAIASFLKARPYRQKVGNPFFIVSDLYTLSDLYYQQGDFRKGIESGKEALRLAEQYDLTLKFEGAFLSLARNYQGAGDFRNASKYFEQYAIAKDSVYKNSSADAIAEMQTRFETEKKEQQLALQHKELEKQDAIIQRTYAVIIALALTVILLTTIFLIVRGSMKRKQLILEKERELYIREAQIQASIQSQERERKRFAQDLHDGMGQLISALRLALHHINKQSSLEERVDTVNKAEHILNEMYKEIRSIAFNLMPQTLVQQGLVPALKEMSSRINGSGKIVVNVTSLDVPARMPEVQEISIYRIIQEWVNNVIKYAEATVVEIQLISHDEEIAITIEDNGKGFNIATLENSNGNGWKNIKSRVNLIKATIDVDSKVDVNGTTLIINVPQVKQIIANVPGTGSPIVADVPSK
jgi:two-component system, NarL family, sensor kinase